MNSPTVCAVMLANGRDAMVARAVASFRAQAYPHARLLVYDTGTPSLVGGESVSYISAPGVGLTIGELRNRANAQAGGDIIVHWDSDDWSGPGRIAEQVELLVSSGEDCVGYSDMLFWRTPAAEAWLYTASTPRHMLGSSMCYWRRAWERAPFRALPDSPLSSGEDWAWYSQRPRTTVSSMAAGEPRMICSIHGGNTSVAYAVMETRSEWRRAPQWTEHCRRIMTEVV